MGIIFYLVYSGQQNLSYAYWSSYTHVSRKTLQRDISFLIWHILVEKFVFKSYSSILIPEGWQWTWHKNICKSLNVYHSGINIEILTSNGKVWKKNNPMRNRKQGFWPTCLVHTNLLGFETFNTNPSIKTLYIPIVLYFLGQKWLDTLKPS